MKRSPARFTGRWGAPGGYGGTFPLTSILSRGGERKIKVFGFHRGNIRGIFFFYLHSKTQTLKHFFFCLKPDA